MTAPALVGKVLGGVLLDLAERQLRQGSDAARAVDLEGLLWHFDQAEVLIRLATELGPLPVQTSPESVHP